MQTLKPTFTFTFICSFTFNFTFILSSGSAIMQDGATKRNGYRLDLDALAAGDHIGMMRCSDGTLHYFLNGVDQGVACTDLAPSE